MLVVVPFEVLLPLVFVPLKLLVLVIVVVPFEVLLPLVFVPLGLLVLVLVVVPLGLLVFVLAGVPLMVIMTRPLPGVSLEVVSLGVVLAELLAALAAVSALPEPSEALHKFSKLRVAPC